METVKTSQYPKNEKLLSVLQVANYLTLPPKNISQLIKKRKIPCSKYSGKNIDFFEDVSTPLNSLAFYFSENTPIDEENEPP